jgi:hypothetical protein
MFEIRKAGNDNRNKQFEWMLFLKIPKKSNKFNINENKANEV